MASGYSDSVDGTALTEPFLDDYLMKQVVMKYASAAARTADGTLTAALREGMVSYLDDLNVVQVYSGSAWSTIGPVHGAWTSWTPTVSQSSSVTVTVTYAKYMRIGRLIIGTFQLAVTGSGTSSNAIGVSGLPATPAQASLIIGSGRIWDNSATTWYGADLYSHTSGATLAFHVSSAASSDPRLGVFSMTAGLASSDILTGTFQYEANGDA